MHTIQYPPWVYKPLTRVTSTGNSIAVNVAGGAVGVAAQNSGTLDVVRATSETTRRTTAATARTAAYRTAHTRDLVSGETVAARLGYLLDQERPYSPGWRGGGRRFEEVFHPPAQKIMLAVNGVRYNSCHRGDMIFSGVLY